MNNKETHIKSLISTLMLCLSLLVYTAPSAASLDHQQGKSHAVMQDMASPVDHEMSEHCKEMQEQAEEECCQNGNCDCVCISGTSAISLGNLLEPQFGHADSINALSLSSLRSQADKQPTPPPIN